MRRVLLIVILCLLAVASTGCKKARLRSQLKELMGSTIVLPEKISCVYKGEVYPMPDSVIHKPKLIVYIDSTECTACKISHFWEYQNVFDLAEQTGKFEVIIMLENFKFESVPLTRYLIDQCIKYPVHVDKDCLFMIENPHIPNTRRFHSFLLNSEGHVLFVGDPAFSKEMLDAFILAVKTL